MSHKFLSAICILAVIVLGVLGGVYVKDSLKKSDNGDSSLPTASNVCNRYDASRRTSDNYLNPNQADILSDDIDLLTLSFIVTNGLNSEQNESTLLESSAWSQIVQITFLYLATDNADQEDFDQIQDSFSRLFNLTYRDLRDLKVKEFGQILLCGQRNTTIDDSDVGITDNAVIDELILKTEDQTDEEILQALDSSDLIYNNIAYSVDNQSTFYTTMYNDLPSFLDTFDRFKEQ